MAKKTLEKLNRERAERNEALFINTRNAAAGSLKLLDSKVTAERGLMAFIHSVGNTDYVPDGTGHYEALQMFRDFGFPVNEHTLKLSNIEEVIDFCSIWELKRSEADYEIDGIVIKVNEIDLHSVLGATAKYPRWLVAYKFKAEQIETILKDVHIQIGKTGVLTPVAELEPVFLSGSTVSKASLHNIEEIFTKDIRIGDTVIVEKAGEIIPQVVKPLSEKRTGSEKKIPYPAECPVCKTPVEKDEEGIQIRCPNIECPAQVKANLLYYGSPEAMNIEGLGVALVAQLYDKGLVQGIADLYSLAEEDVAELDRMGAKSAANLIREIRESRERGLARILTAVGIRHIGRTSAEILARHFSSMENIAQAKEGELVAVDGIGPVLAVSIIRYFESEVNRNTVKRLQEAGVVMEAAGKGVGSRELEGKSFIFTGTLLIMTRKEAQEHVRSRGGTPGSSVSSKTDYLVAGESPGSKHEKAQRLGIPVLSEDEFRKLLGI